MKHIGDILNRYKEAETVKDDVTYKQVTIGTNYKGVRLRGTKRGADIGTKNQWLVKAGQFILSRIDARNSAFGIIPDDLEGALVTNDFMAYDVNEAEVDRDFFNVFLQSPQFLEACQKASRGNTNRKRVQEEFFLSYEVELPDIDHQRLLIQKIERAKAAMATAEGEITHQQTLIGKLKQAILQEAIQGKLTAEWRAANLVGDLSTEASAKVEPASELLQRIQAEKARLIAKGKIKKQKKLPEIKNSKNRFLPPIGWAWKRLADVYDIRDGTHDTPKYCDSGIPLITSKNISSGSLNFTNVKFISEADHQKISQRSRVDKSDILFAMIGSIGNPVMVLTNKEFSIKNVALFKYYSTELSSPKYLLLFLKYAENVFKDEARGAVQPFVSLGKIRNFEIPLPPLAEQAAIVERVEALMASCRELEAEIERSRTHAADLLQAVLKEAFAPAS